MFATDRAPGVYYQAVDAGSPPVTPLRTDICAFIGIAERGPVDVPVPIESWQQFVSWFGGCIGQGYLAYAVRGFLENGGRRCWVVRVTSNDPVVGSATSSVALSGPAGRLWSVRASSDGTWGDQLTINVRERNLTQAYATGLDPDGQWSRVSSVAGLSRGTLVRISQSGKPSLMRVVSMVDPVTSRVHWVHPEPEQRLPYDRPLAGLDPDGPVLLASVEYRMLVHERGRLIRV
ncbi:MAG: hypothetical protein ABI873_11210, partial [Marmoricola sp.]